MSRNSFEIRTEINYEERMAVAMWSVGNDRAAEAAEHRVEELYKELREVELKEA